MDSGVFYFLKVSQQKRHRGKMNVFVSFSLELLLLWNAPYDRTHARDAERLRTTRVAQSTHIGHVE